MNVKLSFEDRAKKALIQSICILAERNPKKNIKKIFNLSKAFTKNPTMKEILSTIEKAYETQPHVKTYIEDTLCNTDPNILKTFIMNLASSGLLDKNYDNSYNKDNIPFSIIISPSSKCNLKCDKNCNHTTKSNIELDFIDVDKTVKQALNLGIHCIIVFGGEPFYVDFMYKIYEKYNDILFIPFTNGTLFNLNVINKLVRLGNVMPIISLDGFKNYTDNKCGEGTYSKIMNSMKLLKEYSIPFGTYCATLSNNMFEITSNEFIDMLINNGSKLTIYSTPFGNWYDTSNILTTSESNDLENRIKQIRKTKPYFVLDLFNDDKYIQAIFNKYPELKNSSLSKYENNLFANISSVNIKHMSLGETLKFER